MYSAEDAIAQTRKWINDVIVGCNFCPFAANVIKQQSVWYQVDSRVGSKFSEESFLHEVNRLDTEPGIETLFIIYTYALQRLDDYFKMVSKAEGVLLQNGYEGIYQVASFHPLYHFANTPENDPANYTNRSVYPMLHLLRESSIDKALLYFKHPENIPGHNILFAREKGLVYMKMLRDSCL